MEEIIIGTLVEKHSRKPFKSGNRVNTVKGFTINPHSNLQAVTFEEDDSIVDLIQIKPISALMKQYRQILGRIS